jgi:hypothetical protein
VVDRVVEDVVDRVVVLLLRLDHPRPEPLAEEVVPAAVPLVEGAGVLAVQVAHAVGEIRQRGLDEEVVVVAEQAAGVEAPAIVALDPSQNLEKDPPVVVVLEDRSVVVALRADVVVGAGGEVTVRTSHPVEGNARLGASNCLANVLAQGRHGRVTCQAGDGARGGMPVRVADTAT